MSGNGGSLSVEQAHALMVAAYRALAAQRQAVNDLNVYPVPDGDTGTNLSLTLKHVVDDLRAAPSDLEPAAVCSVISNGALMGARGNSGVILSQMVRGAVEPFAAGGPVTPCVVASSLARASERAYGAVRRPVEGTMLTVIREMAEIAGADPSEGELAPFLERVLEAGWESVRRTPTLLKVLADAGVVDAGGYGLMVLVEGMVLGSSAAGDVAAKGHEDLARLPDRDLAVEEAVSPFTYCTSFLLAGADLDGAAFEEALSSWGDSLLVVGDPHQLKVHIHTDHPGTVLAMATERGALRDINIDNMKVQTTARDEHLRSLDGVGSGAVGSAAGDVKAVRAATEVVAVVSGEGLKRLYQSLGTSRIVDGGQSLNPSAQELLRAVEETSAAGVVLLPNNRNIILAAEQVARLTDRHVVVVPTRSMQAGLAAMVAFDSSSDTAVNLEEMSAAVEHVATGGVTRAVRASVVDGLNVREGDYIGLVDDQVVATGEDMGAIVESVAGQLVAGEREIVTLFVGDGSAEEEVEGLAERLRSLYPDLELEVHQGDQPLYPLLMAAE